MPHSKGSGDCGGDCGGGLGGGLGGALGGGLGGTLGGGLGGKLGKGEGGALGRGFGGGGLETTSTLKEACRKFQPDFAMVASNSIVVPAAGAVKLTL